MARAAARRAGVDNNLAGSVAGMARALDHEETLLRAHLAVPITCAAGAGRRAGTRAGAVAGFAHGRARQIDLAFGAVKGFFQRDINLGAQIRAAALLAATTTAPAAPHRLQKLA